MPSSLVPGQCMASYGPDGARVTEVLDGVTPGVPMLLGGLVLFAGGIGRSDLPDGDGATLLDSIRTKLFPLPDDAVVLPGHGPPTTIGREKRTNPFLN